MPIHSDEDGLEGEPLPELTLWQRILVSLPHFGDKRDSSLSSRLKGKLLKPEDPAKSSSSSSRSGSAYDSASSVGEIEAAIKHADDKERMIGLIAAPIGAAIALVVSHVLIVDDPPATLNGKIDTLHVNPTLYVELGGVVALLAVIMLMAAFFRKRTIVGITMALYGLAIFNLHYWGFGLPFIMGGAWYLVRAYRLNTRLKEATGEYEPRSGGSRRPRPQRTNRATRASSVPNKRFTPPTPSRRRPAPGTEK